MPRDYIHCYVAEQSAQRMKELSLQLADSLSHWRLGAVFPDAGFYMPYLLLGKRRSGSYLFPHDLHGSNGQDPAELFTHLKSGWMNSGKPSDLAFIFGCASHFITDITFHPYVYYHTGNYYNVGSEERKRSIYLHRVLETAMDVFLLKEKKYEPFSMKNDWVAARDSVKWACESLEASGWQYPGGTFNPLLYKSARLAVRMHYLFQQKPLTDVMRLLKKVRRNHNTAALFYSGDYHRKIDCFKDKLFYVNPVTGKPNEEMFNDMIENAINQTVAFCKDILWPYFDGDTDVLDPLPSLDFGVVGGRHDHLNYSADNPITQKLI